MHRIQADVLVLERVHQLVGDRYAGQVLRGAVDDVQHLCMRIVEADDLLLEQIRQKRLELQGVGNHAEALVSRFLPSDVVGCQRVSQLFGDELADLLLGTRLDFGWRLELQPDRFLDHRHRLRDFCGIRSFVLRLLAFAR